MAAVGFTPIQLYRTATASAAPSAGNLADGELAINTNDGLLFYKDSGGVVRTIASAARTSGVFAPGTVSAPGLTFTGDTNTGIYSPAADTIAFTEGGVEAMRLDASGNVGIGTTSPQAKLVASNSGAAGLEFFTNYPGGGVGTYIQSFNRSGGAYVSTAYDAADHAFRTNNSERMRIDNSGNVGIGTSSPASRLHVSGSSGITTQVLESTGSVAARFNLRTTSDSNGFLNYDTGNWIFFNNSGGSAVERMRIDTAGNVGIGTSSPNATLHLYNATNPVLRIAAGADAGLFVDYISGFGANINVASNFPLIFGTNNAERARITSGGNLLVGTTVNNGNRLVASGGTNGMVTDFINTTANGSYITITQDTVENWAIGQPAGVGALVFTQGRNTASAGTERARITSGGEVYIAGTTDQGAFNLQVNGTGVWGAGAYVNGSDARIKDDIAPLTSGLDVVAKLKPVQFRYKESWAKDTSLQPGFIAQDLQEALGDQPYVDGVVLQGPEYMSVAYQSLIPLLTKAIQEQQSQIETLKARVAALENK